MFHRDLWLKWFSGLVIYITAVLFVIQYMHLHNGVNLQRPRDQCECQQAPTGLISASSRIFVEDHNHTARNKTLQRNQTDTVNTTLSNDPQLWKSLPDVYGWRGHVEEDSALKKSAYQLVEYKPPVYTSRSRAPCFSVQKKMSRNGRNKTEASQSLHCLPSIFVIGISKSGTTDIYEYLTQHRHVIKAKYKEPMFWTINSERRTSKNTFDQYLKNYEALSSLISHCCQNPNEKLCTNGLSKNSNKTSVWREVQQITKSGGKCPFVSVDATAVSINDAIYWQDDPANKGFDEIQVYTPHRIKYFVPEAKLLLMLREPVTRLISDFYFFMEGSNKIKADYLHTLVINGIAWWKSCTELLSETQCAFGVNYETHDLRDLHPGVFSWGDLKGDGDNGAARLRVGMYVIYIEKWLEVFQRRDLLVIQTERYSKNITQHLKNELLPFLDLDPLANKEWAQVHLLLRSGPRNKNTKIKKKEVHEKTRVILQEFYKPYNVRLAKLLNNKDFLWL